MTLKNFVLCMLDIQQEVLVVPGPMLHLSIAKMVCPNAGVEFYVGNLAPDGNPNREQKDAAHFYNVPDRETALREFAQNANNDYLIR